MTTDCDVAVIGGGFFGCMIALHLRRYVSRVVVLEREPGLLRRASLNNQARVHNGYHYPRSPLTAFRSRVNFPRFVAEFADCVDSRLEKYYAVARTFSKVTAAQFRAVFERTGAPIAPAPDRVRRLFNPDLIEDVFTVQEYAFDADRLAQKMARALEAAGVEVRLGCEVVSLRPRGRGEIALTCATRDGQERGLVAGQVFNCTYSRLNRVLAASGLPTIRLKHEVAEMALVDVPEPLRGRGITVMCGPFFSIMPFPTRGLYTLSHVRYTPHESWSDGDGPGRDPHAYLDPSARRSNYPYMVRDAARYLPLVRRCAYAGSIWEVKTVLTSSEADDSRPILMRKHHGLANMHCVLGAKIDNIYDALEEVDMIMDVRRAG